MNVIITLQQRIVYYKRQIYIYIFSLVIVITPGVNTFHVFRSVLRSSFVSSLALFAARFQLCVWSVCLCVYVCVCVYALRIFALYE